MGELLGQLYVDKHYQEDARARMETMIANLVEAYRQSIENLEWMGEETKQQALVKLSKFSPKIGYPENWRDYSSMEIVEGDLIANVKVQCKGANIKAPVPGTFLRRSFAESLSDV